MYLNWGDGDGLSEAKQVSEKRRPFLRNCIGEMVILTVGKMCTEFSGIIWRERADNFGWWPKLEVMITLIVYDLLSGLLTCAK